MIEIVDFNDKNEYSKLQLKKKKKKWQFLIFRKKAKMKLYFIKLDDKKYINILGINITFLIVYGM